MKKVFLAVSLSTFITFMPCENIYANWFKDLPYSAWQGNWANWNSNSWDRGVPNCGQWARIWNHGPVIIDDNTGSACVTLLDLGNTHQGGIVIVNGGQLRTNHIDLNGENGTTLLHVKRGHVVNTGDILFGFRERDTNVGSLVQDGGLIETSSLTIIGTRPGHMSTLELNGGILKTHRIQAESSNGYIQTVPVFNGGTIQAASSGNNLLNLNSVIKEGGITFDTNRKSNIITAQMYGPGRANITGGGNLTYTADNTYSGPTAIGESTTLNLGNGGTSGSVAGNVNNNGALVFNRSNRLNVSGVISGTGSVHQVGSGTTVFQAPNTYSGPTIVSKGGLSQGAPNTFSPNSDVFVTTTLDSGGFDGKTGVLSGSGTVTNSGSRLSTLSVGNTNNSGTFSGTIKDGKGTTSITKEGTGTQVLTGNNTYTGGTTIDKGTVQLGDGGTTGSIVGDVTNNGILAFNRADAFTFSGVISGTGSVTQIGTGTTTLISNNTYTGTTFINNGAIEIGNGGITGSVGSGDIVNNSKLIYNRSNSHTVANVISGNGNFIQAGTGTTTLISNNTYTGTTFINRGAIEIGNGGTTGSVGSGDIVNNSKLIYNRSNSHTVANVISGNGNLIQVGTGTTALTSNNTYTGRTIISDGTLQLGNGGTTGSIVGNVTNNSVLVFNRSNTLNVPGVISGTGTVNQVGSGTTVFQAANTYSGITTVSKGGLTQDGANKFSPNSDVFVKTTLDAGGFNGKTGILLGSGTVTNSGPGQATLSVGNTNHSGTFSGIITDKSGAPFSLEKVGIGKQTLTGNNTYTGDTIITSGILELGDGGTSGSIVTKRVVNHGNLVFNRSDATVYSGIISGSGMVTKEGRGAHTLTGKNSYSGGTIVVSGTLIGTTDSLQKEIANHAHLEFNNSLLASSNKEGNFNGRISGNGSVTINSPRGKVNFNTAQTYTGTTVIQEGELSVNAPISSLHTIIQRNGILSGAGHFGGHVENFGAFKPGNSIGTCTIKGNYKQSQNGSLFIQLESPTSYDHVAIDGMAQLGGTLEVEFLNGFVPNEEGSVFTILTAKRGVKGTFEPKIPKRYLVKVIYDAYNVILIVPSIKKLLPTININIKDIIFNATNAQYGQITDWMRSLRAGFKGFCCQGISNEPMQELLNQHESKIVRNHPYALVYSQPEPSRWEIFANASGVFSKINNTQDIPRINAITGFFNTGAGCRINEYLNVGIYSGYQSNKAWYTDGSTLRNNGVKLGLYGTAQWNGFYLNGILGGGAHFFNLNRSIDISKYHWSARSNPFGGELNSLLGGGYEYQLGSWRFGANTSIQYTYLGIPTFNENGAGNFNAKVGRQNPNSLVYTLGANVSYLAQISPTLQLFPTAGLYWQHEFLNYSQQINGRFDNGRGLPFTFSTPAGARNNAFGSLGITAQFHNFSAYAYYNPQFGGLIFSNAFLAGISYNF